MYGGGCNLQKNSGIYSRGDVRHFSCFSYKNNLHIAKMQKKVINYIRGRDMAFIVVLIQWEVNPYYATCTKI